MTGLFKRVCNNKGLKIGPRVLRHLVADSDMYAEADGAMARGVAFLAGHSLETEERVYRNKLPSSATLSLATQFCYDKQVRLRPSSLKRAERERDREREREREYKK